MKSVKLFDETLLNLTAVSFEVAFTEYFGHSQKIFRIIKNPNIFQTR